MEFVQAIGVAVFRTAAPAQPAPPKPANPPRSPIAALPDGVTFPDGFVIDPQGLALLQDAAALAEREGIAFIAALHRTLP